MAAYNRQRNSGTNGNFGASFPRGNFGGISDDRSMPMRRPIQRDVPVFQQQCETAGTGSSYSSRPQPSFPRYDEQIRGPPPMLNTGNSMQNTFTRPDLGSQSMSRRSDFTSKGMFAESEMNGRNAYPWSELSDRNAYPRSESDDRSAYHRSASGDRSAYPWSGLCDRNAYPRSESAGREVFSRPEFSGSGMFPSPQLGSGGMFSRPHLPSNDTFSRSRLGGSGMNPSLQMNNSNMISGPQRSSRSGMFAGPPFSGTPMSGVSWTPPRMPFPCGGVPNQKPPPSMPWNHGPDSYPRRTRPQNFSSSPQEKPLASTRQNKAEFKPNKKKSKKRRFAALKDDGKKMKAWMTDELYAEVKKKNEMYVKAKASDSAELWQEFRLHRNKVSSLIKEAKMKGGFITRIKKEDVDDGKEKPFSCDTCDRAYAEESKLEEHLKEHKKCEINGCQFEAHPKIVELHKKMQHDTGYADIISKLDDDAEIKKWRNERKSHFPTLENVRRRQAVQEEKLARGEILETKDFGKFKKRRCEGQQSQDGQNSRGCKFTRGRRGKYRGRVKRGENRLSVGKVRTVTIHDDNTSDSDDDSHIKLHKFPGTAVFTSVSAVDVQNSTVMQNAQASQKSDLKCVDTDMLEPTGVDSSAIYGLEQTADLQNLQLFSKEEFEALSCENVSEVTEELILTEEQTHHKRNDCSLESDPLSNVLNNQKVNDKESDDEGPAVKPIVKETETTCHVTNFTQDSALAGSEDKDQESHKVPKHTAKPRVENTAPNSNREPYRKLNGESAGGKKSTLLEKLLANDIRHERNIILQCIRYTLNNNFFGVAGYRTSKS